MQEMYGPEQLVIKINALYLAIFPPYKVDHLINETGINSLSLDIKSNLIFKIYVIILKIFF
jgi:hypothetical protein